MDRNLSFALLLLVFGGLCSCADSGASAVEDPLPSLREFTQDYGRELDAGERAALGQRYDSAGSIALINGRTRELSHAETAARYLESWSPPIFFAWDDLSYHLIEPELALVLGRFKWARSEADTSVYSYAGIVRLTPSGWRIRAEIETRLP